jgi:hypothetical protein
MVAATNDASSVKLVRLLLDGSPDPSFGTNGIVLVPTPVGTLDLSGFTLRPDGSGLLLGSVAADGGVPGFGFVIQVSVDGTIDTSFGTNGLVSVGFPDGDVQLLDLALESSGALVVCGVKVRPNPTSGQPTYKDAVALRVDASGMIDLSFNGAGAWIQASEPLPLRTFTAKYVHLLPTGHIVLRGPRNYLTAPGSDGWQITLLPDGTPVAALSILTSGGFGPIQHRRVRCEHEWSAITCRLHGPSARRLEPSAYSNASLRHEQFLRWGVLGPSGPIRSSILLRQ